MKRVKPASGLVNALGYEVCRAAKLRRIQSTETFLSVRHRAGVEPNIDKVCLTGHLLSGRTDKEYVIDIRPVEINPVVVLLAHVLRIKTIVLKRIACHESGFHSLVDLGVELCDRADADLLLSVLGAPDRKRCAPETAAAEVPVLDILKPLAETSRTGGLRLPGDRLVQSDHLVLDSRGLDEPGVERIIEDRFVGSPAVRIAVGLLLDPERPAVHLHHHAKVDVEGRSVSRKRVIKSILHIAAGIFLIRRVHVCADIFRIKVFDRVEASVVVHLGLPFAVLVKNHHSRHTVVGGDFLVIRTEGRSDVNDSGTVLGRDIVSGDHPERLPFLDRLEPRNQLLVADSDKVNALERTAKHLVRNELVAWLVVLKRNVGGLRIEPRAHQVLGQHVDGLLSRVWIEREDTDIFILRPHAERCV